MDLLDQAVAQEGKYLDAGAIRQTMATLEGQFSRQKVLVLIPDHTRTIPLPRLFRELVAVLHDTRQLDFMVALGTHPPLASEQLCRLVGITAQERKTTYRHAGLLNHTWDAPDALHRLTILTEDQLKELAGEYWHPSLGGDTPVDINRAALTYDHIIILGPTFPHEVAGFSGGAKYLFPGISGPDIIHKSHWLGALVGAPRIIGIKDTVVRAVIHAAAAHVPTPTILIGLVVVGEGLAGMFIGDLLPAWNAAADLSAQRHITWVDKPFQRILSCAPPMYDELWTASKAMYKLEPVLAEGGELIVYAPHLKEVSRVHGRHIYEIGYHVLPYFLAQWDRFKHIPLGVIAHSTHLRGDGWFEDGVERPRAKVTLATCLPPAACTQLGLNYRDPAKIDVAAWQDREAADTLLVPKAGEMLYRLKESGSS